MSEPRSAAIYARISSDVTGEGLGVARQLKDCRKLAESKGWTVGAEYVDNDISAFKSKPRPQYDAMLRDLELGVRDAVIVYNADRLTRRPIQLEQFIEVCEHAGIRHVATVTQDIDLGNDDGLFMARILAIVAAKESGRKSERLKRKARETAERGLPGGGSNRPFGYESDKVSVNEPEAQIIRSLAERSLAGESTRSLAQWLNDQDVPTATGADWTSATVRGILLSARIAGLRAHHGEVVGPAVWEAIISPEIRDQLLRASTAKRVSGRRVARRYLLSGMLRCGKCSNKLFSSARRGTRRYVCMKGPDHGGCGRLTVVAAPVEEWIAQAVLYRLDTTQMDDTLRGRRAADEQQDVLLAQLAADQSKMAELATMFGQGEISRPEWMNARAPIEARVATSTRQLAQHTGSHTLDGLIGNGQELAARWSGLNLERQNAIVRAVLDYATIAPGTQGSRSLDPNRIEPAWRL